MTFMTGLCWFILAFTIVGALCSVAVIGQPRNPRFTAGQAVFEIVWGAAVVVICLRALGKL